MTKNSEREAVELKRLPQDSSPQGIEQGRVVEILSRVNNEAFGGKGGGVETVVKNVQYLEREHSRPRETTTYPWKKSAGGLTTPG